MPLPLNLEILKWSIETYEILSHAKVPGEIKFYNIYGTENATPHTVWYDILSYCFHQKSSFILSHNVSHPFTRLILSEKQLCYSRLTQ